jgi:large subunit ribosomal protein L33
MAKKKGKRRIITLESTESKHRTYATFKNVDNTPDRLELKKYDPKLRKRVVYKEVK